MPNTWIFYSKSIIRILFVSVLVGSCNKDDASSEEATDRPYTRYMLTGYGSYVEIPHRPALNPEAGITLEGWVRLDNAAAGNVLITKKPEYKQGGYVVGVREQDGEPVLYSYMGYEGGEQRAGHVPIQQWVHWAVTSDGRTRKHYINGKRVGEFAESGSVLIPSAEPLFLAKNVPAHTGMAELRLWNIARTQNAIKADMLKNIIKPAAGLVAVWQLHHNANDLIGGYHGVRHNNPTFKIWSN